MSHDEAVETAFRFCPRCGRANDSPGQVPFRCRDCQMACFFGPVAAVGALITDEPKTGNGERLLLVRRAREPGKGKWGLPGGFVDRDETVEEALAREVKEETNLEVTRSSLLITRPNQYAYGRVRSPVIDLFYECQVRDRTALHLCEAELSHHEWTRPDESHLSNMAFESNRIAIEHWLRGGG